MMCYYQGYRGAPGYGSRRGYGLWANDFMRHNRVPVNIEEKPDRFELFLFAPALVKENISIAVKDDVLKVSYQPVKTSNDQRFTRHEYHPEVFERSFVLNGKVITENISATYAEGVITVLLPKNPAQNKPAMDITVA